MEKTADSQPDLQTLQMPHEPKLQPKLCQRASKANTKSKNVY